MSKKLNWLDAFAEEQAKKESNKMNKTAGLNKKAKQIIVNCGDVPGVENGSEINFQDTTWKVIDANFSDDLGPGVVLEKLADGEEEEIGGEDEMVTAALENEDAEVPSETQSAIPGDKKVTDAPERAYTDPGNVYHIEVRDTTEVQNFQSAAQETEQQIAQENSIDRTVPAGKYSVNRVFNQMMGDVMTEEGPTDPFAPEAEEDFETEETKETENIETPEIEENEEVDEVEIPETEETEETEISEEDVPAEDEFEVEEEPTDEDEPKKEDKFAKNKIMKKILSSK